MKHLLFFPLLFISISLLAQYPANPRKQLLGVQTTGQGLVYIKDGAPAHTPSDIDDAWMVLDTTNSKLYYYDETANTWDTVAVRVKWLATELPVGNVSIDANGNNLVIDTLTNLSLTADGFLQLNKRGTTGYLILSAPDDQIRLESEDIYINGDTLINMVTDTGDIFIDAFVGTLNLEASDTVHTSVSTTGYFDLYRERMDFELDSIFHTDTTYEILGGNGLFGLKVIKPEIANYGYAINTAQSDGAGLYIGELSQSPFDVEAGTANGITLNLLGYTTISSGSGGWIRLFDNSVTPSSIEMESGDITIAPGSGTTITLNDTAGEDALWESNGGNIRIGDLDVSASGALVDIRDSDGEILIGAIGLDASPQVDVDLDSSMIILRADSIQIDDRYNLVVGTIPPDSSLMWWPTPITPAFIHIDSLGGGGGADGNGIYSSSDTIFTNAIATTDTSFQIKGVDGQGYLYVDDVNKVVAIGDYIGNNNSTHIVLDDGNSKTTIENSFRLSSYGGGQYVTNANLLTTDLSGNVGIIDIDSINADAQTLSISGDSITVSGGNTVVKTPYFATVSVTGTRDTVDFDDRKDGIITLSMSGLARIDTLDFLNPVTGGQWLIHVTNVAIDTITWPDNLLTFVGDTLSSREYTPSTINGFALYYDGTNYNTIQAVGSSVTLPAESTFETEYQAILDYATTNSITLPHDTVQTLQNAIVRSLKDSSIWSSLDALWVFATDGDSLFAGINWVDPGTNNVSPHTSGTDWEVHKGYTLNGSSGYVNTNFNPSTDGTNYVLNSSGGGMWNYYADSLARAGVRVTGNHEARFLYNENSKLLSPLINTTSGGNVAYTTNGNSTQFYRTNSTNVNAYLEGVLEGSSSSTSSSLPNGNIYIGARNDLKNTAIDSYTAFTCSVMFLSANISSSASAVHTILNTYIDAL